MIERQYFRLSKVCQSYSLSVIYRANYLSAAWSLLSKRGTNGVVKRFMIREFCKKFRSKDIADLPPISTAMYEVTFVLILYDNVHACMYIPIFSTRWRTIILFDIS